MDTALTTLKKENESSSSEESLSNSQPLNKKPRADELNLEIHYVVPEQHHEEKSKDSDILHIDEKNDRTRAIRNGTIGKVVCDVCGEEFSSAHCLRKHCKRKHKSDAQNHETKQSISCVQCSDYSCATMVALIEHMRKVHGENLEVKQHTFQSLKEFSAWKEKLEKETSSWFVVNRKRLGKCHTTVWYRCNRTGVFKPSGTGKRVMKRQGTSKMNGCCTAYMRVSTSNENGKVTVEACLGHIGHAMKLGHLRMPKHIRQKIVGNLAKGVTIESILDEILENSEKISREHLVDRKDILNIRYLMEIDLMEKDVEDAKSVNYWVTELGRGEASPILLYKPQGRVMYSLPKNDFLLGIQTQYQLEKLKKHGKNIICMDTVHKNNQNDFQLISILIIDEFGEGVPVGWLISNREDQLVLYPFLAAIEARAGVIKTAVFMSDDSDNFYNANNFYNAWINNFPMPEKKLLCAWHVDKNWRKGLGTHIGSKDDLANAHAALKTMQYEKDESEFRKQLQEFCAWSEKTYPSFYKYFSSTYVRNVEQWAFCFRVSEGLNNMSTEAFQKVLKVISVQKKQNRRTDHLLCKLLKIGQDKVSDDIIKNEKIKRTHRIQETDLCHKRGKEIGDDIIKFDDANWHVHSQENEDDWLTVKTMKTCNCIIRCTICGVCRHMYHCSCTDFSIRDVACKHVHAVHMRKPQESIDTLPIVKQEEIEIETEMLIENSSQSGQMADVENLWTDASAKLSELTSLVQRLTNPQALQTVMELLDSLITVTRGLEEPKSEH